MTWSPARHTQRFANRLLHQHAVMPARRFGIARVVARRAHRLGHAGPRTLCVAVHLDLVVRGSARATTIHAGASDRRRHGFADPARTHLPRRASPTIQVERLLARRARVDRLDARPATGGARSDRKVNEASTFPIARPVPRVLRREAPSRDADRPVERPVVSMRTTSSVALPSSHAMTPGEVDRLTEQVLRTIDRRLLAFRERHGRS